MLLHFICPSRAFRWKGQIIWGTELLTGHRHTSTNHIIAMSQVSVGIEHIPTDDSYNESQQDALFLNFILERTLHASDIFTVHHQEA